MTNYLSVAETISFPDQSQKLSQLMATMEKIYSSAATLEVRRRVKSPGILRIRFCQQRVSELLHELAIFGGIKFEFDSLFALSEQLMS